MKFVAITMRNESISVFDGQCCDYLDARWHSFLQACNSRAVLVPNNSTAAIDLMRKLNPSAILLSGGGNIYGISGVRTPRDDVEDILMDWAQEKYLPLIGICRGMQAMIAREGVTLRRIDDHVNTTHPIEGTYTATSVNSFHEYGVFENIPNYKTLGRSPDGTIEIVQHITRPWLGIGWHPERNTPFQSSDVSLITSLIEKGTFL